MFATVAAALLLLQPTSRPAEDFPALRKRLAELQSTVERLTVENKRLAAENLSLKEQVESLSPAAPSTAPAATADQARRAFSALKKGMPRADADALLQRPRHTRRTANFTDVAYVWQADRLIPAYWISCRFDQSGLLIDFREGSGSENIPFVPAEE